MVTESAIEWGAIPRHTYGYEQREATLRWALANGAQQFIVAYAGVRVVVRHIRDTLVSVYPKSPRRGSLPDGLCVCPPDREGRLTFQGQNYDLSYGGGSRLQEAIGEVCRAWQIRPGRDSVYAIVGAESGHCAMCGALLTDPLSCSRGIGPECWRHIGADGVKTRVRRRRLASVETYYAARRVPGTEIAPQTDRFERIEATDAQPIDVKGLDRACFVWQVPESFQRLPNLRWDCCEASSGMTLGTGASAAQARTRAEQAIAQHGAERTEDLILRAASLYPIPTPHRSV